MGPSQSAPFSEELSSYEIISKSEELGTTYLIHQETDKEYCLLEHTFNEIEEFERVWNEYKSREKVKDEHLTRLSRVEKREMDQLCSTIYKIFALWEYPHRSLFNEIEERKHENKRFEEPELWSILASCVLALSTLQNHKIKHGKLSPKTILLNSQNLAQVADPLSYPFPSNFEQVYTNRSITGLYLSPEECDSLQCRSTFSDPHRSDVWVLGMIILECGLLKSQSRWYRDEYTRIDYKSVEIALEEFGREYGAELRFFVGEILKIDGKDRPNWYNLEEYARNSVGGKISINAGQKEIGTESGPGFTPIRNMGDNLSSQGIHSFSNAIALETPQMQRNSNQIQPPIRSINPYSNPHTNHNFNQNQIQNNGSFVPFPYNVPQNHPYPQQPEQQKHLQSQHFQHSHSYKPPQINTPIQPIQYIPPPYQPPQQINASPQNTQSPYKETIRQREQGGFQHLMRPTEYSSVSSNRGSLNKSLEYSSDKSKFNRNFVNSGQPYNPSPNKNFVSSGIPFKTTEYQNQKVPIESNLKQNFTKNYNPGTIQPIASSFSQNNQVSNMANSTNETLFTSPALLEAFGMKKTLDHMASPVISQEFIENKNESKYSYDNFLSSKLADNNSKTLKEESSFDKGSKPFILNTFGQLPTLGNVEKTNSPQTKMANLPNMYPNNKLKNTYVDLIQEESQEISSSSNANKSFDFNNHSKTASEKPEYVIENFKEGSRYEGYKLGDMRHGQGKFYYKDGGLYDGNWRQNKMDGQGSLYYQSGKIAYEGSWLNDQFHGRGKLSNESPEKLEKEFDYQNFDNADNFWKYYEGDFVNDCKSGKGILMFSNGEYFEGTFVNDMVEGPGVFYRKNETIKGNWSSNQFIK